MSISVEEMRGRVYKLTVTDSRGQVEHFQSSYRYLKEKQIDIRNLRTRTVHESLKLGESTSPVSQGGYGYTFTRIK